LYSYRLWNKGGKLIYEIVGFGGNVKHMKIKQRRGIRS